MTLQAYALHKHLEDEGATFYVTRDRAQSEAKTISPEWRDCCRIFLVEVPTTKEEIVSFLNGGACVPHGFKRLRAWTLTRRGGIVEVPVDHA